MIDVISLVAFAGLYWLYRNRARFGGGARYAKDPVCAMQVEIAHAPASTVRDGRRIYFCSEHCQHRYDANPDRYVVDDRITEDGTKNLDTVDPVCGMTVDPQHAGAQVTHLGRTVSFCCGGCADAFQSNPDAYLLGDGSP